MRNPAADQIASTARGVTVSPCLLVGALLALSLAPIALVDIPALVDYPNHLARMSILARAGTTTANPFYEPAWGFYPNLAMDLLVPPLARLIGVVPATRLFCLVSQVLVVSGAMALSMAVRRAALGAGITACLCLYATPFAFGFLNFEFGIGLSLWAIAAWIRLARGSALPRLALHAAFVLALYLSHLFALGAYGFVIGVWELWRARAESRRLAAVAGTFALMAAPVAALGIAAVMLRDPAAAAAPAPMVTVELARKIVWLCGMNGLSVTISCACTGILAMVAYAALRNRCVRLVESGTWLLAGFALLYLAMPFGIDGTAFVDARLPVVMALVLPAFTVVEIPSARWRHAAIGAVTLVGALNLAATAWVQAAERPRYDAVIASFQKLAPGSRVLVAAYEESVDPLRDYADDPINHVPVLAALYADAFVPTLFANPGQNPIRPVPASRRFMLPGDREANTAMLAAVAAGDRSPGTPAFIADWMHDYDYVYVLRPSGTNPVPDLLEPVQRGASFALYRVRARLRGALP